MTQLGFSVDIRPVITLQGLVVVVRSEEGEGWWFPEIQLDPDDSVDRAAQKGVKDLLDLDVGPHQLIDAVNVSTEEDHKVELYIHVEADDRDIQSEEREGEWVDPAKLDEYLVDEQAEKLERREISNFVEKLKKVPSARDD